MHKNKSTWLMGSATGLAMVAGMAALISAQWKHETLPFAAFGVILLMALVKSRWVVLDYMGLRGERPRLAAALLGWVAFFALAAAARAFTFAYIG